MLTAFDYGQKAYAEGKPAIPALDHDFLEHHIKGLLVGEGIKPLEEWARGWHEANRLRIPSVNRATQAYLPAESLGIFHSGNVVFGYTYLRPELEKYQWRKINVASDEVLEEYANGLIKIEKHY